MIISDTKPSSVFQLDMLSSTTWNIQFLLPWLQGQHCYPKWYLQNVSLAACEVLDTVTIECQGRFILVHWSPLHRDLPTSLFRDFFSSWWLISYGESIYFTEFGKWHDTPGVFYSGRAGCYKQQHTTAHTCGRKVFDKEMMCWFKILGEKKIATTVQHAQTPELR